MKVVFKIGGKYSTRPTSAVKTETLSGVTVVTNSPIWIVRGFAVLECLRMLQRKQTKQAKSAPVKITREKEGRAVSVEDFLKLKRPKGDLILAVDDERVSLTSLDRVYWPDEKLTKFDLIRYYLEIGPHILPFLKNRPAILQRYPRGIKVPMFFQQDLESAPAFVKTVRRTNQEGRELDYAVFTTIASMLHFVNQGNVEQHPWHSTVKHLDKPDYLMLDLDPKQAPWENVLQVALVCKQVLDELRLPAFPKTSGSSGLHIYLPLKPKYEFRKVAAVVEALAAEVAQRAPKIATVTLAGETSETAGLRGCHAECTRENDRCAVQRAR